MNKKDILRGLLTLSLMTTSPFISFAESIECQNAQDSNLFSVEINSGEEKCDLLGSKTNIIMCKVTEFDIPEYTSQSTSMTITEHYIGPDIVGVLQYDQNIDHIGQRFNIPAMGSIDTLELSFKLALDQQTQNEHIAFACKYHTYS